jgi:surface antigen
MRPVVRALTVVVALIVGLLAANGVPGASAAGSVSVRVADASLLYGKHTTVTGDVGKGTRSVRLQRRSSGTWRTVASSRSRSNGTFTLRDPQSRIGTYRVYVPRAKVAGHTRGAAASRATAIRWQSSITAPASFAPGEGMKSPSGRYLAVIQRDGNFVVYDQGVSPQKAMWNSATQGSGLRVKLQSDGNMVVYSGSTPKWSSSTAPAGGVRLAMQDDGNLVMYSRGGIAVWGSYQGKLRNNADAILPRTTIAAGNALHSRNGKYRAVMQRDGNFVVYGPNGAEWSTRTGVAGSSITLQEDGNLVVYAGGTAKWSSSTARARDARLVMQDDGNLVMYSKGGLALWSTRGGRTGFGEDTLPTGAGIGVGQSLWSHDGRFNAVMQGDGNFVVYGPGGARWSSGTGTSGSSVHMQSDGNLVVYAPGGVAKWSSTTSGTNAVLVMQDDSNLVIYSAGRALWSSNGNGAPGVSGSTGGYPDADATDCSATYGQYSWCKGGNWYHPTRRFAYRNCTDFVAWKKGMTWSQIQYGGSGHAYQWKAGWESRGRTVSTTPRAGAVAYWGQSSASSYGHVAYVVSVNSDGSAHIAEYNRGGNGTYGERDVRAPYYLY